MLDFISKQLQERFAAQAPSPETDEPQMNDAILEYAHLFQELDDLTAEGTESESDRPFTKIDIPIEDDVEIDSLEINMMDGRVTDIPMDATVQEQMQYAQMRTYDSFFNEAYELMERFPRESESQFTNRVHARAEAEFAKYKNYVIQEGLFGFDKIPIDDNRVPARVICDFGEMPGKDSHYYVKLPIAWECDTQRRILQKQLNSISAIQHDDHLYAAIRSFIFDSYGKQCGIDKEEDIWNVVTPSIIVVPIDPIDQYCVSFGFDIDGTSNTKYIQWSRPIKSGKQTRNATKTHELTSVTAGDIRSLHAIKKGSVKQESALMDRPAPSRFFQEDINFGDPDEAPAGDPNASSVTFDANAGTDAPPADNATPDAAPAADAPAGDTAPKEVVDTNDVSDQIAEKISDETNSDGNAGDDATVDATADSDVSDVTADMPDSSDIDADLGSLDGDASADTPPTDGEESGDMSDVNLDNMTIDELLAQGADKLKGMTIQQLKDFLSAPDGTTPDEVKQEAFFLTRGNIGKELDIHLRKTLGILNNNDMEITELIGEFRKEGKQLNRVVSKASKMKKVFNEAEIKQLLRLNHCLSDLMAMMRADIDAQGVSTVKRLVQAFVSEAAAVLKFLEKKKGSSDEPVQEGFFDKFKKPEKLTNYMRTAPDELKEVFGSEPAKGSVVFVKDKNNDDSVARTTESGVKQPKRFADLDTSIFPEKDYMIIPLQELSYQSQHTDPSEWWAWISFNTITNKFAIVISGLGEYYQEIGNSWTDVLNCFSTNKEFNAKDAWLN